VHGDYRLKDRDTVYAELCDDFTRGDSIVVAKFMESQAMITYEFLTSVKFTGMVFSCLT